MKNVFRFSILLFLFATFVGCTRTRTYEAKDVYVHPNSELGGYLEELGMTGWSNGDITYKAKQERTLSTGYLDDGGEQKVLFIDVNALGFEEKNLDYRITSEENGGYNLAVEASLLGEPESADDFHRYPIPHDSMVGTDLKFKGVPYVVYDRFESDYYIIEASLPCTGNIKVFRVDGNDIFLSKEMVASDEYSIWTEYYANGNVKCVKTIAANPDVPDPEADSYSKETNPFVTNSTYYFEDGTQKTIEKIIYQQHGDYAVFKTDYRIGGEQVWAIFLKNEEMIVFVTSNDIRSRLQISLRYNYEIRDNRLRFYNGYEVYGFGGTAVNHYAETSADIFIDRDGDGVTFSKMKKYGARENIHMSASLTNKTLSGNMLDFVREYAHTTRRVWNEKRFY